MEQIQQDFGLSIAKQLVELNGGKIDAKYIKHELIIEIEMQDKKAIT